VITYLLIMWFAHLGVLGQCPDVPKFALCPSSNEEIRDPLNEHLTKAREEGFHDWLSFTVISTPNRLDGMGACWKVPPEPSVDNGQIVHYWIGLEPVYPPTIDRYWLVQPVLQWIAPSLKMPQKGWVIKNEVTSCVIDYSSVYTPVNVGERVCGSISLFAMGGVNNTFVSVLMPDRTPIKSNSCKLGFYPGDMKAAYVVLELSSLNPNVLNDASCAIFPSDTVFFENLNLRGLNPPYTWTSVVPNPMRLCQITAMQTHLPVDPNDGKKVEIFTKSIPDRNSGMFTKN